MRCAALLLLVASPLAAQSLTGVTRAVDAAVASGSEASTLSVGITRIRQPGDLSRVRLGIGLRATAAYGTMHMTPAGAEFVPSTVKDTLRVSAAAAMINVAGHVGVLLTDRLMAGMNIDLFGFGFGSTRSGYYTENAEDPGEPVNARPTASNIFLYGSNDRGSLNSQFHLMWALSDRHAIKAGLSHQLVEYRTDMTLASGTSRFRRYADLFFVGVQIAR